MRYLALLSLISIHHYFVFCQSNIETPFGFDRIKIEMTTAELVKEMGPPEKIVSYEEEKKVWLDADYDLDKALVYHIGFDQVYVFDYQNDYCLWKAYIKDDRVIYMNLTSRFVRDLHLDKVSVRNQFGFGTSASKVEEVLGKNFFPDRAFSYTDYLYADLGIRFTFKQNHLTNIYLFRRFKNRADLGKLVKYYPKDN